MDTWENRTDLKLDILKFVYQDQRDEMKFRRERAYRIFTWSSTILSALIGVLLITKQTETVIWKTYGIWGNVVASITVVLIVFYSIFWQQRTSRYRSLNAQVISRISRIFHFFDDGFFDSEEGAIFPDEWKASGQQLKEVSMFRLIVGRLFKANYISATFLLGILAIIMIWLP